MLRKPEFKTVLILILMLGIFILLPGPIEAKTKNTVNIYFFHSETCSHCQKEWKLLNNLKKEYKNLQIYSYEIEEENNKQLLIDVGNLYGINVKGVPVTIIGNTIYTGYSEEYTSNKFIKTIEYYSIYGYEDRVENYLEIKTESLYKVNESDISLKEFMNSYNNYRLIFNIYTDDIDINYVSLLIGFLLGVNIFNLIGLLVTMFINRKNSIRLFKFGLIYIISNVILYTIYNIIDNLYISVILSILLLIPCILRITNKYRHYLITILIAVIFVVSSLFFSKDYFLHVIM